MAVAATSTAAKTTAVASAARCLLTNFPSRYRRDGGHASTASCAR